MSQQSSNKPPKGPQAVSRRRFVQTTALLSGISVSGRQLLDATPVEAAEPLDRVRVAQAPPVPAARAVAVPAQLTAQGAAAPPISAEEFIRLSHVLTGFDDLAPDLAEQYLQRCSRNDKVQPLLRDLVNALSELQGSPVEIEQKLLAKLQADNGRLFGAAEQIIYLWYVGGFFHPNPNRGPGSWDYGPPDHYFHGKAWAAIGVNPPITPRNRVYWTQPRTEV